MAQGIDYFSLYFVFSSAITLSVLSLFVTLFIDFTLYGGKGSVKLNRRTVFAAGGMTGFYGIYYVVLQLGWGEFRFVNGTGADHFKNTAVISLATALIFTGAVINIAGRLQLKGNWANRVTIYDGHTLVTGGIYKFIRHPLYASIIYMHIGGCLAFKNLPCAFMTAFILTPLMCYRARQEESLLRVEFMEYDRYMKNTGMFFPKFRNAFIN
jgi:protein-S-isoprenylcysteine O-methyltransferase Ste14